MRHRWQVGEMALQTPIALRCFAAKRVQPTALQQGLFNVPRLAYALNEHPPHGALCIGADHNFKCAVLAFYTSRCDAAYRLCTVKDIVHIQWVIVGCGPTSQLLFQLDKHVCENGSARFMS